MRPEAPRGSAGRSTRRWSLALLGVFAFNYVFTQTLLATHPEISVIK